MNMNTNPVAPQNNPQSAIRIPQSQIPTGTLEKLARLGVQLPDPLPPTSDILTLTKNHLTGLKREKASLVNDHSDQFLETSASLGNAIALLDMFVQQLTQIAAGSPPQIFQNPQSAFPNPQFQQPSFPNQPLAEKLAQIEVSPGESKLRPGEPEVSPGESEPRPTASEPSPGEPQPSLNDPDSQALIPLDPTDPLYDIAEDLQIHARGRSPFDKLTPVEQATIAKLLRDHTAENVAAMIAKPPPLGFNFKTCKASVNRFRRRYQEQQQQREADQAFQQAQTLLQNSAHPDKSYLNVTEFLLKTRLHPGTQPRRHPRIHHRHHRSPKTTTRRTPPNPTRTPPKLMSPGARSSYPTPSYEVPLLSGPPLPHFSDPIFLTISREKSLGGLEGILLYLKDTFDTLRAMDTLARRSNPF